MAHRNAETLQRFYAAFSQLDAESMAACYAPTARFEDPAFSLQGQTQVAGMWRMLCAGARKSGSGHWKIAYSGIEADDRQGRAHWEAHYLFSATGRQVHNVIDAEFSFTPEGLIASHRDRFSFWRWSRQALGLPGLLLGWSPSLKRRVRATAAANLRRFMAQPSG